MQIAYKAGVIYLRGINLEQLDLVKGWGFSYNRDLKFYEAIPSVFTLNELSKFIKLPPELQDLHKQLVAKQKAIDTERFNQKPVAMIEPPVKVKLFDHQVRALNMALEHFGVI